MLLNIFFTENYLIFILHLSHSFVTNTSRVAPLHTLLPLPLCFYCPFSVYWLQQEPIYFFPFFFPSFFFNGYISLSLTATKNRHFETGLSSTCWVGQRGFNSKAPRINTSLWLVLILSLLMVDVCCQNSWKASAVICCSGCGDFNEQSCSYIWDHLQNPLPALTRDILEIFHMEKQPNSSCCTVFSFMVGLILP